MFNSNSFAQLKKGIMAEFAKSKLFIDGANLWLDNDYEADIKAVLFLPDQSQKSFYNYPAISEYLRSSRGQDGKPETGKR